MSDQSKIISTGFNDSDNNSSPDSMISVKTKTYKEQGMEVLNQKPKKAISTGFESLDSTLNGGFRAGNLVAIAGKSSMGKSTFIYNIASNIIKGFEAHVEEKYSTVVVLSLNPHKDVMLINEAQSICTTDRDVMFNDRVIRVSQLIVDRDYSTFEDIKQRVSEHIKHSDAKILFIDDIQLIQLRNNDDLDLCDKMSYITSGLKNLAMKLQVPIVITYPIDEEKNNILTLIDFDDADSIANDSDIVMFLHRELINKSDDVHNLLELSIAKYRNGITGNLSLNLDEKYCSIKTH